MNRPTWILRDCDEGALVNTLNDLDSDGFVPWELRRIEIVDPQGTVNPKTVVRILSRRKWQNEILQ